MWWSVAIIQNEHRIFFFGRLTVLQIFFQNSHEAMQGHGPEPHHHLNHLPWKLVLEQLDVMMDVAAVKAQETMQAVIYFLATPHTHVLHQKASINEHHISEVYTADTCHHILVVEAANIVRYGGDCSIHLLQ